MRTAYENIISEAKSVFSPQHIYIGFYENMFEHSQVTRLSEFLQIEPNYEFAKIKVNKTLNTISVTNSDQQIKSYYANTYEYFFKHHPLANELWQ